MHQGGSVALARSTDPVTSHAAAFGVDVTQLERRVLYTLTLVPLNAGLTSEELAERLELAVVTVSPRLRPLADKCLIDENGTRAGISGRQRIVWKLTPPPEQRDAHQLALAITRPKPKPRYQCQCCGSYDVKLEVIPWQKLIP